MIEESNKMILDVKQKLVKAIGELRDVMVRVYVVVGPKK